MVESLSDGLVCIKVTEKQLQPTKNIFAQHPILYNGVFGCHGNTRHVIFIGAVFCMIHVICPINVCTNIEINRYKIDQVRKYAKIVFYLTFCDVKTMRHGDSDRYFDQEHIETNQKSL